MNAPQHLVAPANDCAAREWFTAAELAELALPGLPADKRSLNRRARDERWQSRCDLAGQPLARPRSGRGGGIEFHVSLLPGAARIELAARGIAAGPAPDSPVEPPEASAWRWYEAQSGKTKAEAQFRASVIAEIDLLTQAGMTRSAAVAEASRRHGRSRATVWNWLGLVSGIAPSDRLPALAPRHQGGGKEADIDPELWTIFKSDYLRPEEPTLASCYDRTAEIARERGLSVPSKSAFRRRFEREVPEAVRVLRRKGPEALRRSIPGQRRTVDHLHALEIVNVDGHTFDIAVEAPGTRERVRPVMVAVQDVMSSKILGYCLDLSENSIQTQIAFRQVFENYGIPKAVLLDNGRAFASMRISGGSKTRFRNKVKDDEPTGVLIALSINPKWALPYRGQSKPIERAFRDMCDRIAKHPRAHGCYVGNSVVNKPHNYGKRALPWDEFVALVATGVAEHNSRAGRRGRHYSGRSFDDVFAESYAVAPIRKATPEQLRLALLTSRQVTVNRATGEIALFGNRYWSPAMDEHKGQKVTVRFDPENLHAPIFLYDLAGRYLLTAELLEDNGFDSEAGAKASAKRLADYRKLARRKTEMEMLIEGGELAALQPERMQAPPPEAKVVGMVRPRGRVAAALKPEPQVGDAAVDRIRRAIALRVVEDE